MRSSCSGGIPRSASALRVSAQRWRLPGMIPNGLMGADFNIAQLVVVPDQRQAHPDSSRVIDKLLRGGQALAFETRTTQAGIGRSRFVQGGIHAQAGNDRDTLAHP